MKALSWWKRLASWATQRDIAPDAPRDTHESPVTTHVELIPEQLAADIYRHEVIVNGGSVTCWSYVSQGLQQVGQAEIVFTLVLRRGETAAPEEPLKLFRTIDRFARAGQIVSAGGVTQFGDGAFFGRHLMYIAAQPLPGVVIPTSAICAILVTQDELQAVLGFGATRVMARLGHAAGHYPCPAWSDRTRRGIAFRNTQRQSILSGISPRLRPGCSVHQANQEVVLVLDEASRETLAHQLEQMPDEAAFGVLTELDPEADGCLVWQPGQSGTAAITPPGSSGHLICGCFLLFATGQTEDGARQAEDGFAVLLTSSSWRAVRNGINSGERIRVAADGGMMPFVVSCPIASRGDPAAVLSSQVGLRDLHAAVPAEG